MARSLPASPSHPASRRTLSTRVGAGLAGIALAAVLAGCSTPTASNENTSTSTKPGLSGAAEIVVVCESGVVTGPDGIDTSSSVAMRLPAGSPIPEGCRLG